MLPVYPRLFPICKGTEQEIQYLASPEFSFTSPWSGVQNHKNLKNLAHLNLGFTDGGLPLRQKGTDDQESGSKSSHHDRADN